MAKIVITYGKESYTLEYDRESVEYMVNRGLTREEISSNPFSYYELFYGAFRKHHPYVNRKVTDKIWDEITGKEQLLGALVDMYAAPINALISDPDEGNATWEIND